MASNKYQGLSENERVLEALNPRYFPLDERQITDYLQLINDYSKQLKYFNSKNEEAGDWQDFFWSDDIFLLAEIINYDLKNIELQKINLLQSFDTYADIEKKTGVWVSVFGLCLDLLQQVDRWYSLTAKFNKNRFPTKLEEELSGMIEYVLAEQFRRLISIDIGKPALDFPFGPFAMPYDNFSKIWKIDAALPENIFDRGDSPVERLDHALKQLLILYRNIFKSVSNLQRKAPEILNKELEKDNHEPHIGLLLAFIQLLQIQQNHLNDLTKKHLEYYFKELLKQKFDGEQPDLAFIYFLTSELKRPVKIPKGTILLAGQDQIGNPIRFQTQVDTFLNNTQIADIKTLFVSRNPLIDSFSQYRMVNGIFKSSIPLVGDIKGAWPTLGEDQTFKVDEDRNMKETYLGLILSSPNLHLASGVREIHLVFDFEKSSIQHLTKLLVDIANKRGISPEEVFYEIFVEAFTISLTAESEWFKIPNYKVILPDDFTNAQLTINFSLPRKAPAIVSYNEETHQSGVKLEQPAIKIELSNKATIYPYSFLDRLKVNEIQIVTKVKNLGDYHLFNSYGPLDATNGIEFLGPMPKKGDYFMIGSKELFSKNVTDLDISWKYSTFPFEEGGLKEYFEAYQRGIENDSFKISISGRSDYQFNPFKSEKRQVFNLFDFTSDQEINSIRKLEEIDIQKLEIKPDYQLKAEAVEQFHKNSSTGFLKFELISPAIGFGFEVYPKLFSDAVTHNANQSGLLKGEGDKKPIPNNPFIPTINDLNINYVSKHTIVLDERRIHENNPETEEAIYHLHPFGQQILFADGKAYGHNLFPQYEQEGYLFLGLEGIEAGDRFNLLFDLEKSEKWEIGRQPYPEWIYLNNDQWKSFQPADILSDQTKGLIETGIISLRLPKDAQRSEILMPDNRYWIGVNLRNKAELVSKTKRIYTNAVLSEYKLEMGNQERIYPLPTFTISELEEPIPGVMGVVQPLPSFGGKRGWSDIQYFNKVSERLRHKNRAISRWDIERLVLNQFEEVGQVKCIGNFQNEQFIRKGNIIVIVIPKIKDSSRFYEPTFSQGELNRIKVYLQELTNPFTQIEVRNPTYEYLRIKGKIIFNELESGEGILNLVNDTAQFICPWFFANKMQAALGGSIKISDLFNFIQGLPYVEYLTGFSIGQIKADISNKVYLVDTANEDFVGENLEGGTPWSVFLLSMNHDFEVLEKPEYHEATPTKLSEMRIGEDLLIASSELQEESFEKSSNLEGENQSIDEKEDNQFWFKLKL